MDWILKKPVLWPSRQNRAPEKPLCEAAARPVINCESLCYLVNPEIS